MPIPREGFNTPVESIGTWASHWDEDVLRPCRKKNCKSVAEMTTPARSERVTKSNQLVNVLQRSAGQTETGTYFIQGGANASGWTVGNWIPTLSRNATPASVSIDTAIVAPAASAGTPSATQLTSSGFFVEFFATAATNTGRCGGNWTVQYIIPLLIGLPLLALLGLMGAGTVI